MKTVYDGKVKSSLQRLDELGLDTDIWASYFRNRTDFGASFVIPVIGAESCGKSTISADLAGIMSADYLLPTDYIRLCAAEGGTEQFSSVGTDELKEVLKRAISKKISFDNTLTLEETLMFTEVLKGTGLEHEHNVGNSLTVCYALAHSRYFQGFLEGKPNRTTIVDGVHLAGYPEILGNEYDLDNQDGFSIIKNESNTFVVVPISLVFNDDDRLARSYTEKRLARQSGDADKIDENLPVILGYNALVRTLSEKRGSSPIVIDGNDSYDSIIGESLFNVQEAIKGFQERYLS